MWGHGGGRGKRGGAAARKAYRRKVDGEKTGPNDVGVRRKEDMSRVLNGKPEAIRISSAGVGKKGAQKGKVTLVVWNG